MAKTQLLIQDLPVHKMGVDLTLTDIDEQTQAQKKFPWRVKLRDAETTILIKFAFWKGVGEGKIYGKLSKNAVFPGKFHDNKIWKFCEFYCQKFCCHLGGPYKGRRSTQKNRPPPQTRPKQSARTLSAYFLLRLFN